MLLFSCQNLTSTSCALRGFVMAIGGEAMALWPSPSSYKIQIKE